MSRVLSEGQPEAGLQKVEVGYQQARMRPSSKSVVDASLMGKLAESQAREAQAA